MAGRVAQLVALLVASSALAQPSYGPFESGTHPPATRQNPRTAERAPSASEGTTPAQDQDGKSEPAKGDVIDASVPPNERAALPAVDRPTTPASGNGPGSPTGAGWLAVIGPLALVVVLIVGVGLVLRRAARASGGLVASLGAGGRAPAGLLEVLGRYPVGMGQTLVLLKIDRRVLLLAQSRTGRLGGASFTTLAEFTDPDEVASLLVHARDEAGESLAQRFRAALGTFGHDEHPATFGAVEQPNNGPIASVRRRLDALRGGAA